MKNIISTIIIYTIIIFVTSLHAQTNPCVGTSGQITWEIYRGLYDGNIPHLLSWHNFPYHPYDKKTLFSTKSPVNYENLFGARMRGFINVPQSDSVVFNLTGNDQAQFFLSTNNQESNKVLRASLSSSTLTEEFTKFPSQTSVKIFLQQGQDYYFEIIYADPSGGDFANLWWKTINVDVNNWKPITFAFLKDIGCLESECPLSDTPCNDNNPNTEDDKEDGYCHCIGNTIARSSCIGPSNKIENFRYDNITGSSLNDLYNNSQYPAMPSYSEMLPILAKPSISTLTNFGRSTKAYLKVPVSGNYKFNITGDDNTVLFISSNESELNKTANMISFSGSTGTTEYTKYSGQTSNNIFLNANQYYYLEVNNKQGSGSNHFSVYWQTPFTEVNQWKRLPAVFLHKNECLVACIPQGTLCDDGNIFTNNDAYTNDCECVGTPCNTPNCNDPQANYIPYEKCNVTTNLDDRNDVSWQSCAKTVNPNPLRPISHWIKYDLGEKHRLLTSQIWNYNVPNAVTEGFQNVAIDISNDGLTWEQYGIYNWPLANGSNGYGGFNGPDFQGSSARYILITSLDNDSGCKGIGKTAFKAVFCPNAGTACDDKNIGTTDDKFDNNCLCKGILLEDNLCTDLIKVLGDSLLKATNYSAVQYVKSISDIKENNSTSFIAGNYIELNPGFSTVNNAVFIAAIDSCNNVLDNMSRLALNINKSIVRKQNEVPTEILQILKSDDNDNITVQYYVEKPGFVTLEIKDNMSKTSHILHENIIENQGYYTKIFRTKKMDAGIYNVAYTYNGSKVSKNFIVE